MISRFEILVSGLQWVSNYEGNRWFLVLQIHRPYNDERNRLLRISNMVAAIFRQPALYAQSETSFTSPSRKKRRDLKGGAGPRGQVKVSDSDVEGDLSSCFHISIGWTLSQPTSTMEQEVQSLMSTDGRPVFRVDVVKTKVGNTVTSHSLAVAKSTQSRGII